MQWKPLIEWFGSLRINAVFLVFSLLFTATVTLMGSLYWLMKRIDDTFPPRVHELIQIESLVTTSHLWMEELLAGTAPHSINTIISLLQDAQYRLLTLKNRETRMLLAPDQHSHQIDELARLLNILLEESNRRYIFREQHDKATYAALYDTTYQQFRQRIQATFRQLRDDRNDAITVFQNLQIAAFVLELFFFILAGASLYFFARKRDDNFQQIHRLNTSLEQRIIHEVTRSQNQQEALFHYSRIAAIADMIGNIAHHWRQPLNYFALLIQDIRDAYENGELDEAYIQKITADAMEVVSEMSRTIDNFRKLTYHSTRPELFRCVRVVSETLQLFHPTAKEDEIRISFYIRDKRVNYQKLKQAEDYDPLPCSAEVLGYPEDFKYILLGILTNAKDAINRKQERRKKLFQGRIYVHIEPADQEGWIQILIGDNGGGFKEEDKNRLFELYYSTRSEHGVGVSLFMAKQLVEQKMNGTIAAENRKKGALFTLRLPINITPFES